jgi:hypothetical protein
VKTSIEAQIECEDIGVFVLLRLFTGGASNEDSAENEAGGFVR